MKTSVFIYGPAGCGKTTNAEGLRQYFGLDRIVDEYSVYNKRPSHKTNPEGDLIIGQTLRNAPWGVRSFSYDAACAMANIQRKVRP